MTSDKDHVAGLAIQVPDKVIQDAVRAAIVAAIPDKDRVVEQLVRKAMEEKDPNTYGRATRFESAVQNMIVDEAKAVMQEWLKQSRDKIRAALLKELDKKHKQHIAKIAQQLAEGATSIHVSQIKLSLEDED